MGTAISAVVRIDLHHWVIVCNTCVIIALARLQERSRWPAPESMPISGLVNAPPAAALTAAVLLSPQQISERGCLVHRNKVPEPCPVEFTIGMGAMPRSISAALAEGTIHGPPMVASAFPSRNSVFTVLYSVSPGIWATNFGVVSQCVLHSLGIRKRGTGIIDDGTTKTMDPCTQSNKQCCAVPRTHTVHAQYCSPYIPEVRLL